MSGSPVIPLMDIDKRYLGARDLREFCVLTETRKYHVSLAIAG